MRVAAFDELIRLTQSPAVQAPPVAVASVLAPVPRLKLVLDVASTAASVPVLINTMSVTSVANSSMP